MRDVVELLRRLVSISSVSRESNRGVIAFAKEVLGESGWFFEEYSYRDPAGVEKINLLAWPDQAAMRGRRAELALVCHTDTVPYADDWKTATVLTADGEDLKGCGACDVKGFLACILAVAGGLTPIRPAKAVCIALTADEEIGCVGARHLLDRQALSAKYAIVGEPTSLRPMRAGKGYCLAEIVVRGREAHSAYPENGESAIYRAAALIAEIQKIGERLKQLPADGFSPPWTTVNIGEIQGGVAKNVVPPSCRFLLEWRPVAGQDAEFAVDLLREAIARLNLTDAGFLAEVNVLRSQEGFATSEASPLLREISRAGGQPSGTVAFGTEAPWLNKMGTEAVVFGPGSMRSAHSPREFVPRNELYRCVEILEDVIRNICG